VRGLTPESTGLVRMYVNSPVMGFNVSVPLLPAGLESRVYSTPLPATTNVPETVSALLLGSEPVDSAASYVVRLGLMVQDRCLLDLMAVALHRDPVLLFLH